MDCQIVDKSSFVVVGKSIRVSTKDGENFRRIPQFWAECMQDGTYSTLVPLAANGGALGPVTLGICMEFTDNMDAFTYMIAAQESGGEIPAGMVIKTIPAATWAIFAGSGPMPEAIQAVWRYIWSDFFSAGEYAHAAGPDLEIYPLGDASQDGIPFEVWVPVTNK